MTTTNKIWAFKGEYKNFLNEKFVSPNGAEVEIFAWQNFDGRLGFSESEEGSEFLIDLLNSTYTILFPKIESIENTDDIIKNVYSFKGVTFWNKKPH